MLYFDGLVGVLTLGLWVFCIVDVVTTDGGDCRNLPKLFWLILVLLLPLVGSLVWLVAGRPQTSARSRPAAYSRENPRFPEYDRPGRFAADSADDDEAFLRQCRERAEAQRRAGEMRRPDED